MLGSRLRNRMGPLPRSRKRWSWLLLGAFLVCSAGSAASVLAASNACCPSTDSDERCAWMTPAACCNGRVVRSASPEAPTAPCGVIVPVPSLAPGAGWTPRFIVPPLVSSDRLALATVVLQR